MVYSVKVFIENEAGSNIKNIYNEKTLQFLESKKVAAKYPYPYGFILNTHSGDGDNVDCFVVTDHRIKGGEIAEVVPVHLLEQIEDGEIDHKVIGILANSQTAIDDTTMDTIRKFIMSVFSDVPGKQMELGSLKDAEAAMQFINECRD